MGRSETKTQGMARRDVGRFCFTVGLSTLCLASGANARAVHALEEATSREATLAAELAASGEMMLPRLYETLATRIVLPEGGGAPEPLTLESERVILRALELLEPDFVLEYLETEGSPQTADRRRATIQFMGAAGRATEILRLFGVALDPEEEVLDPSVSRATRQALVSIIRRDKVTFGVLEGAYGVLQKDILPPVVEALGESGDPRAFEFLSAVARDHEDLRMLVLEQVPAIGRSGEPAIEVEMRGYARNLIRRERPECCVAIRAAAVLHDIDAIPALIELLPENAVPQEAAAGLETGDLEVAAAAALRSLTGQSFVSRLGWTRWYGAERAWMVTERAAAFQKLSSSDHKVVGEALEAIAPHALVREEFVSVLSDLLRTRPVEIRLLVCRTIEEGGVREAIPELVSVLDHESTKVGLAAHHALRTLTGRDLPQEQEAWSQVARELGFAESDA